MENCLMDFVDRVYGAALEPDRWPSALETFGNYLGRASVVLRVHYAEAEQVSIWGSARIQARCLSQFSAEFGDPEANPFVRKVLTGPRGEPIRRRSCITDRAFRRTRFENLAPGEYEDWPE